MTLAIFIAGTVYGAGLAFCGFNVFDADSRKEQALIVAVAFTWPVSLPIVFVADELWRRYKFKRYVRRALEKQAQKTVV